MTGTRVMLVDDHELVREGIAGLLRTLPGFSIVAECSDGREAVQLAREHMPDVVLMDVSLKGMNGIAATEYIRKHLPNTRVLILTMHTDEERVAAALTAGANGYLVKGSTRQELEFAIHAVCEGRTYLSPIVSNDLVRNYVRFKEGLAATPSDLTARQQEILQLLCEGRTNREIGELLHLSVKTVESHRAQLMEKLDIRDLPGLVKYAIRVGLISVDS
ncbi:MAG: response regulator transcription factor [Gammaproteobacteria bacterium]|nr:response regulator transcription factor [Gammaproteobacteria bacterium]